MNSGRCIAPSSSIEISCELALEAETLDIASSGRKPALGFADAFGWFWTEVTTLTFFRFPSPLCVDAESLARFLVLDDSWLASNVECSRVAITNIVSCASASIVTEIGALGSVKVRFSCNESDSANPIAACQTSPSDMKSQMNRN